MSKVFITGGLKLFSDNQENKTVTKIILDYASTKYKKLNTRSSALGKLKRSIIDTYYDDVPVPQFVKDIQLSKTEYETINKVNDEKFAKRANNCINIYEWNSFTSGILAGIDYGCFDELYVALLLATGRRSTEIISTGSFYPSKKSDKYAKFKGQLKSKSDKAYTIPLLAPIDEVVDGLKALREIISDGDQPTDSTTLNRIVRKVTGRTDWSSHTLRSIYSAVATKTMKSDIVSANAYVGEILGHKGASTSPHYMCVNLHDGKANAKEEKKQATAIKKRIKQKKKDKPVQVGEGKGDDEDDDEALTVADFISNGRADAKVVLNLVNYYNENGKPPSMNALRRLGSGYTVVRRVFAANKTALDKLK